MEIKKKRGKGERTMKRGINIRGQDNGGKKCVKKRK